MKKFVVVENSRALRVVGCKDPSVIRLTAKQSLVEVPVNKKIYKGQTIHVLSTVDKPFPYLKIAGVLASLVAAGSVAFYFWG